MRCFLINSRIYFYPEPCFSYYTNNDHFGMHRALYQIKIERDIYKLFPEQHINTDLNISALPYTPDSSPRQEQFFNFENIPDFLLEK